MRGSTAGQVNALFSLLKAFGTSKYEAKENLRQGGAKTWHELGKGMDKIFSYSTANKYRDVWKELLSFTKENFNIKDSEKLSSNHIKAYLESKIASNVKYSTFQTYASAIEKLEVALNKWSYTYNKQNTYNFQDAIKDLRESAKSLEHFSGTRNYDNPKSLIGAIQDERYSIASHIQYESGARIDELYKLTEKNLHGLSVDDYTKNTIGLVEVKGKGGKVRELNLKLDTYKRLESHIKQNGSFELKDKTEYRNALKQAAILTNQIYDLRASHGLRWNFAQERFRELQKNSVPYIEAIQIVSIQMGHNRPDITERYLFGK